MAKMLTSRTAREQNAKQKLLLKHGSRNAASLILLTEGNTTTTLGKSRRYDTHIKNEENSVDSKLIQGYNLHRHGVRILVLLPAGK
jgi:hypothetical protein